MKRFTLWIGGSGGRTLLAALLLALTACGKGTSSPGPAARATGAARLDAAATDGGFDFAYDEVGRLVAVSNPGGEAAQYIYDPTGNLLEIRRFAVGSIAILGFSPRQGGAGQVVTVVGAGFNPTAAQNTVRLNGVPATVVSATSAQLTFIVPAGATTGKITVANGANTASSADDFNVSGVQVAITDFSPKLGKAGTTLLVSGVGFDADPPNDRVTIGGGTLALVGSATSTSIQATVPPRSRSGKIRVSSPLGSAVSADDFFVLPGNYVAADIAFARRTAIGTTTTVDIPSAGKAALLLFDDDGKPGVVSLSISLVTFEGLTEIVIYKPDGSILSSWNVSKGGRYPADGIEGRFKFDLGVLPPVGGSYSYMVAIQPAATSAGSLDLQLTNDWRGMVDVDGAAVALTLDTGQSASYTFTESAKDSLCIAMTAASSNLGFRFQIYKPDSTYFEWVRWDPGISQLELPVAGTYTLHMFPQDLRSASLTFQLSRTLTGNLALDGTVTRHASSRAGQWGRYTFTTDTAQGWSLQATAGATFPTGVTIRVRSETGRMFGHDDVLYSNYDRKLDLVEILPAGGPYSVAVESGLDTGTVDLRLVRESTGTLTVVGDNDPTSITLGTAQNGRYTFLGNQGDLVGLAIPSFATVPSGGFVMLTFYRPGNANQWLSDYYLSTPSMWQLPALPESGSYTMRLIPSETRGASLTVQLSKPLDGQLALDSSITRYEPSRAGQMGRYTFTTDTAQGWTLQATTGAAFTNWVSVQVYGPSNAYITGGAQPRNDDRKLDLGIQPVGGPYTVRVTPQGPDTGTVDLRLVREATGTLTVDDPNPPLITLESAQNGRYTFGGTANDRLALAVTSFATSPDGGSVSIRIYRPGDDDLNPWWSTSTAAPGSWQLPQPLPLTTSGYTIRLIPSETRGANLTLRLSRQ